MKVSYILLADTGLLNDPGALIGLVAGVLILFGAVFALVLSRKKIAAFFSKRKEMSAAKKAEEEQKQNYAGSLFANKDKPEIVQDENELASRLVSPGTLNSGARNVSELLEEKRAEIQTLTSDAHASKENAKMANQVMNSLGNKTLDAANRAKVKGPKQKILFDADAEARLEGATAMMQNANLLTEVKSANTEKTGNLSSVQILDITSNLRNDGVLTETKTAKAKEMTATQKTKQEIEDLEKVSKIVSAYTNQGGGNGHI